MKKSIPILLLMTVAAACSVKLVPPAQSDADRVVGQYPGYTLDSLNQGMALFQQTCNRCHKLKNPTSRSEDQWKKIVPTMVGKLRKKAGPTAISDQQQSLITKYLVTMCNAPKR